MKIKSKYGVMDFFTIPLKSAPFTTLYLFLLNIIYAAIPTAYAIITAEFINKALGVINDTATLGEVFLPIFLYVLIIIFEQTDGVMNEIFYVKLRLGIEKEFKEMIVEKRARLHYSHIENNETLDLINRVSSDSAQKILSGFDKLKALVSQAVEISALLILILTQVWWSGIVAAVILLPIVMISLKGGKRNYDARKEATPYLRRSDYLGKILSDRENVEERSAFEYSAQLTKKWSHTFLKGRKMLLRAQLKTTLNARAISVIAIVGGVMISASMLPAIAVKSLTIGMFIGLVNASMNLSDRLSWTVSYYLLELVEGIEYLKDLTAFSNLSEQADGNGLPARLDNFRLKSIEFRNVSFQYPFTDRTILKNCSLKIEEGVHYAIVGINGAGKTTITKILTGMYDNYEGEIFINEKNLRDYAITELKAIFSVVYQDFAKYYITLEENITLGNLLKKDPAKMKAATQKIGLEDAVAKLPLLEKTPLGKVMENGVDLSGGEWQRVAIARTLYSNAQMYILDEPTAALDPISESQVYDAFDTISQGMTTLFITHRLGAARMANKIFVIANGCVSEQGSHDELLLQNGIYAQMFESQKGWYQDVKA